NRLAMPRAIRSAADRSSLRRMSNAALRPSQLPSRRSRHARASTPLSQRAAASAMMRSAWASWVSIASSYYVPMATALSLSHLGSLMRGGRSGDEVGAEERAASLAKRSIKKASKLWALDLAIRCIDLTTLEGSDTPGKVAALCAKGIRPKPGDASIPSVASICIYPARVADAKAHLRGSSVRVA